MNTLISALSVALVVAGWSGHVWWLRRRLAAARRDPLTGLFTRDAFTARATRLIRDEQAVVILADVDDFKQVNDVHGHAAGDALLRAVAQRLAHYAGPGGVAGRLGGDEFVAVVLDRHGAAADLLATLSGTLARPAEDFPGVATTVSLGFARRADFPADTLSALMRRADEAMYTAKRARTRSPHRAGIGRLFATVAGRRAGRRGARTDTPSFGRAA